MKRITHFLLAAFIGLFLMSAVADEGTCDIRSLKKEGISNLNPFYYSSSKVSTISYDYSIRTKEIEVPLFKGEKYKMVFNKKALPKDVIIKIYDKSKSHEGREPVFNSENMEGDILSYEPKRSKRHYVNYVIPKADGLKESGCLVFVLGYQLTFVKEQDEAEELPNKPLEEVIDAN